MYCAYSGQTSPNKPDNSSRNLALLAFMSRRPRGNCPVVAARCRTAETMTTGSYDDGKQEENGYGRADVADWQPGALHRRRGHRADRVGQRSEREDQVG